MNVLYTDPSFCPLHALSPSPSALCNLGLVDIVTGYIAGRTAVAPESWWSSLAGGMQPGRPAQYQAASYGQGGFIRATSISHNTTVITLSNIPQPRNGLCRPKGF